MAKCKALTVSAVKGLNRPTDTETHTQTDVTKRDTICICG